MVLLDAYGRPDRYEYSNDGKFPDGYKRPESGFTSRSDKQVEWEEAQAIVDKYKKQRATRMKQMTPMKTMNSGSKDKSLDDKL